MTVFLIRLHPLAQTATHSYPQLPTMTTPQFHPLTIQRVTPEAAGAVAITLAVPPELRDTYAFAPGQFLTLRATLGGESVRRSYSICSSVQRYESAHEIDVGIKPVEGGLFSNWAVQRQAGETLEVMTPQGRFCPVMPSTPSTPSTHRVAFAAGSGITPVLSIMASTLHSEPHSRFTLVYANQRVGTILFNEALQDLKDRYPARLTLIHILSRQAQDVELLSGRLDERRVSALLDQLLPVSHINEAFVCGPEGMIDAVEQALANAGLPKALIHTERFFASDTGTTSKTIANYSTNTGTTGTFDSNFSLKVVLDGKTHTLALQPQDKLLDVALAAGLDLPYACRGGVCRGSGGGVEQPASSSGGSASRDKVRRMGHSSRYRSSCCPT